MFIALVTSLSFSLYILQPSHAPPWSLRQLTHSHCCLGQLPSHFNYPYFYKNCLLQLKHLMTSFSLFRYNLTLWTLFSDFIPYLFACCSSLPFLSSSRIRVAGSPFFLFSLWTFTITFDGISIDLTYLCRTRRF